MKPESTILQRGIKQHFILFALLPTIIIALLLGVYFTSVRLNDLSSALIDRGSAVASRLASAGEYGVFSGDTEALRRLANHTLSEEVSSVVFYNKEGIELASAGKLNSQMTPPKLNKHHIHIFENEPDDTMAFILPVTLPEAIIDDYTHPYQSIQDDHLKATIIGWLKVELEKQVTRNKEYQVLVHSVLIVLLGLAISGFLAYRMGASVTEPILKITHAVDSITYGKLDTRVNLNAPWELGSLESGINTMAQSLQVAHDELQKNIDQATADLRHTLETIEIQNIELDIARKEAETASKVKSEFLASMSHELRTPLNGIVGFINLLQKTNLNTQQQDYLLTIQKSSNNLLSIINDVLDFSKIEAGKLQLNLESMDIYECVEDALTLLGPSAHEKALEIVPFIYSDVPHYIISDPLRIKQVITNLVSNSVKFTEQGSIVVRVMLEKDMDKEVVLCISVTDTGIGLSEAQQKSIFNAFSQANPNITRQFGGTGLGLVICKKLVEQMHGSIELESALGQGSTFWFTIQAEKTTPKTVAPHLVGLLDNYNVLLYEKHPVTKLSLIHLLKSWGIKVSEVDHEDEIIPTIHEAYHTQKPYDLLIIGMNQPNRLDTLIKDTVAAVKPYHCPVGILANTTDHVVHQEILHEGVVLCLAKPICRQKFYDALVDILKNKKEKPDCHQDISKLEILVVDDNLSNIKLAKALLEVIGVNVTVAHNGEEALNLTKRQIFDLIYMDIHMPIMDGLQSARLIRKASKNMNTPIVALSANILLSEHEALYASKINAYITKPVTEHQFRASIYKWTHKGTVQKSDPTYDYNEDIDIPPPSESVDWNLALELAGGKHALAVELLDMLISSLPEQQKEINKAYHYKDFNQLRDQVHKLHGACCYCGVPRLKAIVRSLENAIAAPAADRIKYCLDQLNQEIDALNQYEIA